MSTTSRVDQQLVRVLAVRGEQRGPTSSPAAKGDHDVTQVGNERGEDEKGRRALGQGEESGRSYGPAETVAPDVAEEDRGARRVVGRNPKTPRHDGTERGHGRFVVAVGSPPHAGAPHDHRHGGDAVDSVHEVDDVYADRDEDDRQRNPPEQLRSLGRTTSSRAVPTATWRASRGRLPSPATSSQRPTAPSRTVTARAGHHGAGQEVRNPPSAAPIIPARTASPPPRATGVLCEERVFGTSSTSSRRTARRTRGVATAVIATAVRASCINGSRREALRCHRCAPRATPQPARRCRNAATGPAPAPSAAR